MSELGPRTRVILSAGLLPPDALRQLQRWGSLPRDLDVEVEPLSVEEVTSRLQAALDNEFVTELRDTDLDALQSYIRSRFKARLYLTMQGEAHYIDVWCSVTPLGEYLIPWQSESISDVLLDSNTSLKLPNQARVHFADVRELYFADTKAFVVCTPQERHGGA